VTEPYGVFTVTMIDDLRKPFEQWLATLGLRIGRVPDPDLPYPLIVVPAEFGLPDDRDL
jgi:hypothetical protein